MYRIGSKMLMLDGVLFILLGSYSLFLNGTEYFSIIDLAVNQIMKENPVDYLDVSRNFKTFTWQFLGLTHIMIGICFVYIVKHGLLNRREDWAWRALCLCVLVWAFVVIRFSVTLENNYWIPAMAIGAPLFILPLVLIKISLINGPNGK